MLPHEVMNEWHKYGLENLITASLYNQIAINKMHLCWLSGAYACPYHNPTATVGHSIHIRTFIGVHQHRLVLGIYRSALAFQMRAVVRSDYHNP